MIPHKLHHITKPSNITPKLSEFDLYADRVASQWPLDSKNMNFDQNRKIFQWFWAIDQVFFKYISGFRPKYMDATDFFEIKNSQMENTNHHILTFWPFFYTLHCLLIWISSGRSRKNNHCNYNLVCLSRIGIGSGIGMIHTVWSSG